MITYFNVSICSPACDLYVYMYYYIYLGRNLLNIVSVIKSLTDRFFMQYYCKTYNREMNSKKKKKTWVFLYFKLKSHFFFFYAREQFFSIQIFFSRFGDLKVPKDKNFFFFFYLYTFSPKWQNYIRQCLIIIIAYNYCRL